MASKKTVYDAAVVLEFYISCVKTNLEGDVMREGRDDVLPERCGEQRTRTKRPRHCQRVKVEQTCDLVRVQAALLRADRLQHACAQRTTEPRHGGIHELAKPLVLRVCWWAYGAGHTRASIDAEQGLKELALRRDCLMHPREHVADVAQRVMGMQVDRSCACAARAAASCQGACEGREERGLARLRENGKGIAGQPG